MMLRFGICGIGNWGEKVLRELIKIRDERVRPIEIHSFDSDFAKMNILKKKYPGIIFHDSFFDFSNSIDLGHICTPGKTHYEIAKNLLFKSINLLIEKPMTLKEKEAWELGHLAIQKEIILQVGQIFRFSNSIRKLKEIIPNSVSAIQMNWSHHHWNPDTNVIYDLLPHPLDILDFLFEFDLPEILSTRFVEWNDQIVTASVSLDFDSEMFSDIFVSWQNFQKKREIVVYSPNETLYIDSILDLIVRFNNEDIDRIAICPNNTIREELLHFIDVSSTEEPTHNDLISFLGGIRNVSILEKINERSKYQK